jgi:hypothetical protein
MRLDNENEEMVEDFGEEDFIIDQEQDHQE